MNGVPYNQLTSIYSLSDPLFIHSYINNYKEATYLIEGIQKTPPGNFLRYYYRITVRAQGAKQGTVVWLQEVFRP